eukprot:COSAG02_NODE_2819_length_7966_cov_42.870726_3_plen_182_part_00
MQHSWKTAGKQLQHAVPSSRRLCHSVECAAQKQGDHPGPPSQPPGKRKTCNLVKKAVDHNNICTFTVFLVKFEMIVRNAARTPPLGIPPMMGCVLTIIPTAEPFALRIFRHQSNFLSAPPSVSSNFLETDWAAIFQWKVPTRNICNAHGPVFRPPEFSLRNSSSASSTNQPASKITHPTGK